MAKNNRFKRLMALFMTVVMIVTMMPMNTLEVYAGGYTKEQLQSYVKECKITWEKGAGSNPIFHVEITLKPGTPEDVQPEDLYAAVGKNINEEALKKGYPSTFFVTEDNTTINADGSRTITLDQGAYFGDDPAVAAKKRFKKLKRLQG